MRVLVVDDDRDQLMLRCLLLQRHGFETIQAGDAPSALAAAAAKKPDCAVVDLYLPDVEAGLGLIRELKTVDKGIRLVLLTGARSGYLAGRLEAKLIDVVIEKSLGSANLVQKLRTLMPAP